MAAPRRRPRWDWRQSWCWLLGLRGGFGAMLLGFCFFEVVFWFLLMGWRVCGFHANTASSGYLLRLRAARFMSLATSTRCSPFGLNGWCWVANCRGFSLHALRKSLSVFFYLSFLFPRALRILRLPRLLFLFLPQARFLFLLGTCCQF